MASKRPAEYQNPLENVKTFSKRSKQDDRPTASPQIPKASLLGLPVELRLRIYEHVFGDRLLHITTRSCKPYDKGAFRPSALLPSWGPISRAWKKWTHTVCQIPGDWERSYKLSKRTEHELPAYAAKLDAPELQDYYTRHDTCSWIQDDFQDRKYNYACSHRGELGHRPHFCIEQEEHAAKLTDQYGQPEAGLERYHQYSKLQLDVLSVCRQIYNEASLLPYQTNTFSFDYPATMQDFVNLALQPRQSAAIQILHTGAWPIDDLALATKCLPSLRYLQYYGDSGFAPAPMRTVKWERPDVQIPRVEVIFDELVTGRHSWNRADWREHAREMELMISGNHPPK